VTILLVEDEPGVRRLVRRMLVERGYRVLEAACGEEALAVYEQQRAPVDLVLTDIVMPSMGGNELAALLLARRPSLSVLFMTGYSEEAINDRGMASHAVPVLKKPFLAEALDRKVRELLEARPKR
jgi:CheY-like chemotaxis protein